MALPICGPLPIVICEQLSFVDNCGQLLSRSTKSTIDQIDKANRHGLRARASSPRPATTLASSAHRGAAGGRTPPSAAGMMPALPGIFQPRHLSPFQLFNLSTGYGLGARASSPRPATTGASSRNFSPFHSFSLSAACGRRRLKIIYDAFFLSFREFALDYFKMFCYYLICRVRCRTQRKMESKT